MKLSVKNGNGRNAVAGHFTFFPFSFFSLDKNKLWIVEFQKKTKTELKFQRIFHPNEFTFTSVTEKKRYSEGVLVDDRREWIMCLCLLCAVHTIMRPNNKKKLNKWDTYTVLSCPTTVLYCHCSTE